MLWTILAYSPDINAVTDAVVVQSGQYLVFNIFTGIGVFLILLINVAAVGYVIHSLLGLGLFNKK